MTLLISIIAISFWLRQITVAEVVVVIMGVAITFFMMISFFFQSYTITAIALEISSGFSEQMILIVP